MNKLKEGVYMIINAKIFPSKIIFDNKEIVRMLLQDFKKVHLTDGIEITVENGALEALYMIKQNTSYHVNIY